MKIALLFLLPLLTAQEPDYALTAPGHGDLSFWARPENGAARLVEGEAALGDYSRTLALRRSNASLLRKLRDRYFTRVRSFRDFRTPEAWVAQLTAEGLVWRQKPALPVVAMAGATAQVPLLIESDMPVSAAPQVLLNGKAAFPATRLPRYGAAGYLINVPIPAQSGSHAAPLEIHLAGYSAAAVLLFDVRPAATLRVRLSEPARVYVTAADGLSYAPDGSIHRIAAATAEPYFHAAGAFSLTVPAGVARLEAIRGPESVWATKDVSLQPGGNPEIYLPLKHWSDIGTQGWHAGDSHVHANYAARSHQNITPQDVRLIAEAEDLHVLNLTAANSYDNFIHDETLFTGRPHPLSAGRHILYWNEEFRGSDLYGHLGLFGLRSLVRPFFTGLPGSASPYDFPLNYHQAKQTQDQGGAVTYMHPGYLPSFDGLSAAGGQPKELPADVALGVIDAMDVLSNAYETASVPLYYRLLNCGFRIGVSAGSDTFLNVRDHYIPGAGRVYVQSGNPLRYDDWLKAYKAGRSFVTNGPIIQFTVDGQGPGGELQLANPRTVRIRAAVDAQVPVDNIQIIINGRPVITRTNAPAHIDESLTISEPSWVAVRVTGPWERRIVNDSQVFAHTTPVYISLAGRNVRKQADAQYFVHWMQQMIDQVSAAGRFANPAQREEALALLLRALEIYRKIAAGGTA
ncbi:MAG TPA: CehA/McbA family metallohydrolase [Bryobacteraceae bacterium]|nr:CehA/McbA family metallohydrolase [Bryobacteraceae bacterium]